jgi:hypothetical protein
LCEATDNPRRRVALLAEIAGGGRMGEGGR